MWRWQRLSRQHWWELNLLPSRSEIGIQIRHSCLIDVLFGFFYTLHLIERMSFQLCSLWPLMLKIYVFIIGRWYITTVQYHCNYYTLPLTILFIEYLSLIVMEADLLHQINFEDLSKDFALKKCRRKLFKVLFCFVFKILTYWLLLKDTSFSISVCIVPCIAFKNWIAT
jgi:hypothetical protein